MGTLFLITRAGMRFSLHSAIIAIFFIPTHGSSFPLLQAVFIFILAVSVTYITSSQSWRVIYILLFHIAGLMFAFLLSFKTFYYPGESVFDFRLAWNVFNQIQNTGEGLYLIAVIIAVIILWTGGAATVLQEREYNVLSTGFDKGIGIFTLIFLLVGTVFTSNPVLINWFIIYFIFSIITFGIIKNTGNGIKEFTGGLKKIGVITIFLLLVLDIVIAAFRLGLPYLTGMAENSYKILKYLSRPFLSLFIKVMRVLYGAKPLPQETGTISSDIDKVPPVVSPDSGLLNLLNKIGKHFLIVAGIITTIIVIYFLLPNLFRWLFSRTESQKEKGNLGFKDFILKIYSWVVKILSGYRNNSNYRTISTYRKLLRWGKIWGIRKKSTETPGEYCRRLETSFPFLKKEIDNIVVLFYKEIYGERELTVEELKIVRLSWKEIIRIQQWFKIFSGRF